MPDLVVHRSMGEKVLSRLPFDMPEKEIFRYALSGPDDWSCCRFYLPWRWLRYRRRAGIMHEQKTGVFLNALAETAKQAEGREKDLLFAYTAGFLCHFYLDSTAHPYILRRTERNSSNHTAFERELDRLEMERMGIRGRRPVSGLLTVDELPVEMKAGLEKAYGVYGWDDTWRGLNMAMRDARRFLRLTEDPYGLWNRAFFWSRRMQVFSYRHREYAYQDPENESRAYGEESFSEIVERSAFAAAERIILLRQSVYRGGPWAGMADISYTTGTCVC